VAAFIASLSLLLTEPEIVTFSGVTFFVCAIIFWLKKNIKIKRNLLNLKTFSFRLIIDNFCLDAGVIGFFICVKNHYRKTKRL
jgi:hypothetical protein